MHGYLEPKRAAFEPPRAVLGYRLVVPAHEPIAEHFIPDLPPTRTAVYNHIFLYAAPRIDGYVLHAVGVAVGRRHHFQNPGGADAFLPDDKGFAEGVAIIQSEHHADIRAIVAHQGVIPDDNQVAKHPDRRIVCVAAAQHIADIGDNGIVKGAVWQVVALLRMQKLRFGERDSDKRFGAVGVVYKLLAKAALGYIIRGDAGIFVFVLNKGCLGAGECHGVVPPVRAAG